MDNNQVVLKTRTKNQVVLEDLEQSKKIVHKAAPILHDIFDNNIHKYLFYTVEGRDDNISKILDQNAGVDYILKRDKDGQLFGIASRTQSITRRRYDTFTIRKARASGAPTEFDKMRKAAREEAFYPKWRMHIYYDKDTENIVSLAIAKSMDILDFILAGYADTNFTGRGQVGQSEFYVVPWTQMNELGYEIYTYHEVK